MQDLCCSFFHPYYFSSSQNMKVEDPHSAKTIHIITTLGPKNCMGAPNKINSTQQEKLFLK